MEEKTNYVRTDQDRIKFLLELYPTETELFDVLNIELEDVLLILVEGGHVDLPEYL